MKKYRVSLIAPSLGRASTYHGSHEASSAREAAEQYINQCSSSSGASTVQREGGIVVVTPEDHNRRVLPYGVELFRVKPGPAPSVVIERAHIVEQIQ